MPSDLEYRLWESERKYRLLFQNVTDNIWVLDVETERFLYQSPAVRDIRGMTPEEAKALPLDKTLTPESYEKYKAALPRALERWKSGDRRTITRETELLRKDGAMVWTEVRWRFFEDGRRVLIMGVTRDISQKRAAEMAREELVAELREALAEKDRLLAENRVLKGLLPICSSCNNIRDENGRWHRFEDYITAHSEAEFTHTICPPCKAQLYPDFGPDGTG